MKYELWIDQWLYNLTPMVKSSTSKQYRHFSDRLVKPELGNYEIDDLTGAVLQNFVTQMTQQYSPASVRLIVTILKRSLASAQEMEITQKNLSDKIKYKFKRRTSVKCLTKAQQRRLENYVYAVRTPKLFGIIICLYTGIRIGELLALTWNDIDLKRGILHVRKTCNDDYGEEGYKKQIDIPKTYSSKRDIPISKELAATLRELKSRSKSEYVIYGEGGKVVSKRSYQNTFGLILKKLKIPHMGVHALRHTFATRALECGMDVKTLSEILGHTSAAITLNIYVHSLPEHKRNMMNKISKMLTE